MEIQSAAVEFANSAHRATPWVELELNSLSASEKAIEYENTVNLLHIYLPYAYSDKPVVRTDKPPSSGRSEIDESNDLSNLRIDATTVEAGTHYTYYIVQCINAVYYMHYTRIHTTMVLLLLYTSTVHCTSWNSTGRGDSR